MSICSAFTCIKLTRLVSVSEQFLGLGLALAFSGLGLGLCLTLWSGLI